MSKKIMEAHNSFKKITIRPFKLSDVHNFMKYFGDENVTRFTRYDTLKTIDEAFAFLHDYCIPHPFCRSICVDGRSAGYIFVTPGQAEGRCTGHVGYGLAAAYWGRGIGGKALKMAISEAFEELPHLVRLQADVLKENVASMRVLEKVGFHREGLLRKCVFAKGKYWDVAVFGLLTTDPRS